MSTPAVPEGKYADIGDGLIIHYQEAGEGMPVLFLHGSGPGASGWSNFRRNYPYFADNGFRAIVPDTLGFGYSSKPDMDYGLSFLSEALKRFTDVLGITQCAVIGNSHGGALAIQFALDNPERVKKLILMAPGGLEEREVYMQMDGIRAMLKAFFKPEGITRESMRHVFGLQLFDPNQITDDIVEERFQIAQTQPKRVLATLQVPNLSSQLAQLQCPVFGLWGTTDRFCPVSGAMTLGQNCKRSRVLLLSECGHWVMVEHPALFNRLGVDFLKESIV